MKSQILPAVNQKREGETLLWRGGGLLYCSFSLRGKDYYIAGFPGKSYYGGGGGGTAIQNRYNDFISLTKSLYKYYEKDHNNNLRFSDFFYSPAGVLYI